MTSYSFYLIHNIMYEAIQRVLIKSNVFMHLNASYVNDIGLIEGKGAVIYYYSLLNDNTYYKEDITFSFLQEVISQINFSTSLNYGSGVSGIGYLMHSLTLRGLLEADTDEVLRETEYFILNIFYGAKMNDITLKNGISGIGLYLIKKFHSLPPGDLMKLRVKECIISAVDQIKEILSSRSPPNYDITIWNGLAGVSLFLWQVVRLGWSYPIANTTLDEIINVLCKEVMSSPFKLEKAHVYFALLCSGYITKGSYLESQLLNSFYDFLAVIKGTLEIFDFKHCGFILLFIKEISEKYSINLGKEISEQLFYGILELLDKKSLKDLFPYDKDIYSVDIGLLHGVTSLALPFYCYAKADKTYLELFGL